MEEFKEPSDQQIEIVRKLIIRKNIFLLFLVMYLPFFFFLMGHPSELSGIAAFLIWVVLIVSGIILLAAKCPRCNNLFFGMSCYRNISSSKCFHCGLTGKK
jgi:hypothetical protein